MKYLSLVALPLVAAATFAVEPQREPWKLDDRERAARRADPNLNAIRRAIAVSEGKTRASEETFIVDGSRNPELVMPRS